MKRNNSNMENRRAKQAKCESKLDSRRGCQETSFKERRTVRRKERGKKDRATKNENENVISQGVDEGKQTETWNLEREHRRKKIPPKTRNREGLWKKGFGGKKRAKNLSYIAGHSCCVSQIVRPVLKNARIAGKTALFVIIWKRNIRHIRTRKGKPTKKQDKGKHQDNEDINNRKPEGPNWKELGFQKGMWEKYVERKAAKMKKGKNNQKQGKMEETKKTRMFSLKGFLKKEEKTTQTWFLKITGKRKPPKTKTKSKCRILKGAVSGESNSHKISANRVPQFNTEGG